MRLGVTAAALLVVAGIAASIPLPLNGVLNLPVVIGPGALIVTIMWVLKGVAIAFFFLLTRKVVPVLNGEGKKKYIPYIPDGPFLPPDHPLVVAGEAEEAVEEHTDYSPPAHGYSPPHHGGHVPHGNGHGPPAHGGHGPPHKGHGPPAHDHHGPPHKGHGPPAHDHHGPPHKGHGPPAHDHHDPPHKGHGPPAHNHHGPPAKGHGPPDHGGHVSGGHEVSSYSHLRKRSLRDLQQEGYLQDLPQGPAPELLADADGPEEMLWTTVLQLDITGCSLKLLCHLQQVPQATITLEEAMLVFLFNNGQQYTAPRGLPDCGQKFPQCPLSGEELRYLLQHI